MDTHEGGDLRPGAPLGQQGSGGLNGPPSWSESSAFIAEGTNQLDAWVGLDMVRVISSWENCASKFLELGDVDVAMDISLLWWCGQQPCSESFEPTRKWHVVFAIASGWSQERFDRVLEGCEFLAEFASGTKITSGSVMFEDPHRDWELGVNYGNMVLMRIPTVVANHDRMPTNLRQAGDKLATMARVLKALKSGEYLQWYPKR